MGFLYQISAIASFGLENGSGWWLAGPGVASLTRKMI
jgi:hypothetical protein